MQILVGELARIAEQSPGYSATWVGYGPLTNIRRKKIRSGSSSWFLVYALLDGSRHVAWPPEHTLEIEDIHEGDR